MLVGLQALGRGWQAHGQVVEKTGDAIVGLRAQSPGGAHEVGMDREVGDIQSGLCQGGGVQVEDRQGAAVP